jgi:hypothetical protein
MHLDPFLGPRFLRRVPALQAWLGRLHLQRCSRSAQGDTGGDTVGEEGVEC